MKNLWLKTLSICGVLSGVSACNDGSPLSGVKLSLGAPNITVKLITLIPATSLGNGSESPNQWQVLLNSSPESMIITYENSGNINAESFTVNSSELSLGYVLESNGCIGFTLESGKNNACAVLLRVATANIGEEDLSLTHLTFSFSGESLSQPTVWFNPLTSLNQESIYVKIIESGIVPIPATESPAIFGEAGVTNTGPSIITGDVDAGPGTTAITGFPPGNITGTIYVTPAGEAIVARTQAQTQFTTAGTLLSACLATGVPPAGHDLTGLNLGTLAPLTGGVYCFSSSAQLTGTLVLSGGPLARYTFIVGSSLTTASSSKIILTNGTLHQHIFWAVGSAVTFGTLTSFAGIVDAQAGITDDGGSALLGSAWVLTGPVILNDTTVTP